MKKIVPGGERKKYFACHLLFLPGQTKRENPIFALFAFSGISFYARRLTAPVCLREQKDRANIIPLLLSQWVIKESGGKGARL